MGLFTPFRGLFTGGQNANKYMAEVKEAQLSHAHPVPHLVVFLVALMLAAGLVWAALAVVDEVTHGAGQVVTSGKMQTIQNLEGGILAELLAREGQVVKKGQPLLRIDDTGARSTFRDYRAHRAALLASMARLSAEAGGGEPQFPDRLLKNFPELVKTEQDLYRSRRDALMTSIKSLKDRYHTIQLEYLAARVTIIRLAAEAQAKTPDFPADIKKSHPELILAEQALFRARRKTNLEKQSFLRQSLKLARKELDLNRPLAKRGVVPVIEVIRLESKVAELAGQVSEMTNSFRQKAAQELNQNKVRQLQLKRDVSDLRSRLDDRVNNFRTQAALERQNVKNQLNRLQETMVSTQDRVRRTLVRSPVKGAVNKIHVTTIGGVIKPGMDIMDVVPLEDSLLVEARIRPTDIAFISPGQPATVKVTAYDFSIYGGLKGVVENISPDTVADAYSKQPYYIVKVRTKKNYLMNQGKKHPIKPGMTTMVDILTGRKTVLQYLLKPFIKARYQALRER